jgi:hypothetical protein
VWHVSLELHYLPTIKKRKDIKECEGKKSHFSFSFLSLHEMSIVSSQMSKWHCFKKQNLSWFFYFWINTIYFVFFGWDFKSQLLCSIICMNQSIMFQTAIIYLYFMSIWLHFFVEKHKIFNNPPKFLNLNLDCAFENVIKPKPFRIFNVAGLKIMLSDYTWGIFSWQTFPGLFLLLKDLNDSKTGGLFRAIKVKES